MDTTMILTVFTLSSLSFPLFHFGSQLAFTGLLEQEKQRKEKLQALRGKSAVAKKQQVQALNNRKLLEQAGSALGAKRTCPSNGTLDKKKSRKQRRKLPASTGGSIKSQVSSKPISAAKPILESTPAVAVTQVPQVTPPTPRNLESTLDTESDDDDTVLDQPTLDSENSLEESSKVKDGGSIQLAVVCCLRLLYVILVQIRYPKIVNVKL